MKARKFLFENDLWSQSIDDDVKDARVSLGTVSLIKFSNKAVECAQADYILEELKKSLV